MEQEWIEAKTLITTFKQNGFESYMVGGAVRDLLLDRDIADIDIVTTASPKEVSLLFSRTIQMSNQHQTILVRVQNQLFEVTTIRGTNIEEDLKSRDLTINSLAMDEYGDVIDLVKGKQDLALKQLRSIDPRSRMTEDPLRMLRVTRFVSELGFTVDSDLLQTIKDSYLQMRNMPVERVVKEWVKLLKGRNRNQAFKLIAETKLYEAIPGLSLHKKALKQLLTIQCLTNESEIVCWTVFCICMDYNDEEPLKPLALSNDVLRAIKTRLHYFQKRREQNWTNLDLYFASIGVAKDVEKLRLLVNLPEYDERSVDVVNELWDTLPIRNRSELALTGRDLLKMYKREQGPWLGDALLLAEKLVVQGYCPNETDKIIQALKEV